MLIIHISNFFTLIFKYDFVKKHMTLKSKKKIVVYSDAAKYNFACMVKEVVFARHAGIATPKSCDLRSNLT